MSLEIRRRVLISTFPFSYYHDVMTCPYTCVLSSNLSTSWDNSLIVCDSLSDNLLDNSDDTLFVYDFDVLIADISRVLAEIISIDNNVDRPLDNVEISLDNMELKFTSGMRLSKADISLSEGIGL